MCGDSARVLVGRDLRVDEEADRHLHGLARLQQLLREAEALELVEEDRGLLGQHVEGRRAAHGAVGGVGGAVEGERRSRRSSPCMVVCTGSKRQRKARRHVGVEADGDRPVEHLRRRGPRRCAACRRSRWLGRTGGRAARRRRRRRPWRRPPPRTTAATARCRRCSRRACAVLRHRLRRRLRPSRFRSYSGLFSTLPPSRTIVAT